MLIAFCRRSAAASDAKELALIEQNKYLRDTVGRILR